VCDVGHRAVAFLRSIADKKDQQVGTQQRPAPVEILATRPELRMRMVSVAKIRLDPSKSTRLFKRIICDDISEFESYMPSHAVGLSQVRSPAIVMHRVALDYGH
jgi:hypothetical protein